MEVGQEDQGRITGGRAGRRRETSDISHICILFYNDDGRLIRKNRLSVVC